MYNNIRIDLIRSECKNTIENLEVWLRNLIDNELLENYGDNYLEFVNADGSRLIKNEIVKDASERKASDPERYPRTIDAMLLDDEIKIICNPNLFRICFNKALQAAYPNGNDVARSFLNQLIPIRNKLYHSNPISVREAEKVMCYSNDVIDSIKLYYKMKNVEKKYNVPTIIKVTDSLGNIFYSSQIQRNSTGRGICETRLNENNILYAGDRISIEVDVDSSFDKNDYTINWIFDKKESSTFEEDFNKITIIIENQHVRTDFCIYCVIISKEDWHRCGDVDDSVGIMYEIAPRK
ncbi:hypothetical protein C1637_14115 [Chryseobacterium lactis]|uniref:Swt1-like HEPN domain-containing protein n=1 Tax=Chryseobacterium lactis TaxID=1241981 RepID=A0A3G6RLQ3_CHRLC|nr:hypothetical protein [Chryseobacterium lactis]AZA83744.1 hypothetical protein EG342_18450 [Chryseobacterium lactis]AZB04129.1 hypothetical protein EG341_09325 [Chryseobacterium lactis]PNW12963.1 hypothetical protein C1637_14115 [Chryseobacterium lactis]